MGVIRSARESSAIEVPTFERLLRPMPATAPCRDRQAVSSHWWYRLSFHIIKVLFRGYIIFELKDMEESGNIWNNQCSLIICHCNGILQDHYLTDSDESGNPAAYLP